MNRSNRAAEEGVDRLDWTADETTIHCPRCELALLRVELDGQAAAACPECRGVLLTNAAFGSIVRERRAGYRGAAFTPRPINLEQLTDPISCPGCQRPMEVHPYYGPGNQIIDSCCRCGVVWIDTGELTAIEQAPGVR